MEKTHWRKNNDSRYISGEDLKSGLNGLKPEMLVVIEKFNDTDSFDKKTQQKTIVTGLFLKEIGGKSLYKPVILNKTNGKFFEKEMGSAFMDDWLNKPVMLYCQPDSRHGFVVRFKKFNPPNLILNSENFTKCKEAIKSGNFTIEQIKLKYTLTAEVEAALIA